VGGATPADLVVARAAAKAQAVADRCPAALVVGADTVVAVDGHVLGKPSGSTEASDMLRLLQGRVHSVWTGLALVHGGVRCTAADEARVWMRPLDGSAIEAYVRSGEPLDKAGAYAIQGRGAALVRRLEGDFFTVVGLSVAVLVTLLEGFGVRLPG
jgi:septum formation protein